MSFREALPLSSLAISVLVRGEVVDERLEVDVAALRECQRPARRLRVHPLYLHTGSGGRRGQAWARAGGRARGGRRGGARDRKRTALRARASRAPPPSPRAARVSRRSCRSPVGPWAGGAGAGSAGAVRNAAAAHAIDGVLLLHPERQHVVLHPPRDRRWPRWRIAHLVGRRAGMLERAWQSNLERGRVPPPRAARRAQR